MLRQKWTINKTDFDFSQVPTYLVPTSTIYRTYHISHNL